MCFIIQAPNFEKLKEALPQCLNEARREPIDVRSFKMEEQTTPPSLLRLNRYISATVSAGLAKGRVIGDGIKD